LTIWSKKTVTYPFTVLEKKGFNLTQGMVLLLLKPLNLPANYVMHLILWITNPANGIGYDD